MTMITKEQAQALDGHTPGPWTMETVRTSCGTCHRIGPFPRPVYSSRSEGWACVYDDYPPGAGSPDLLANARLIAAAPGLLATVIALHERVEMAETIARNGKDTIATVMLLEIAAALADHERVVLTRDEASLGPRIMEFAAILKEATHV